MLYISITTYHRLLKFLELLRFAFRENINMHKINDMNASHATQTLDIYDVTEIHIRVTFKRSK